MNTLDTLKTRRSCRAFTDEMPRRYLLEQIAECGTYAPSGRGAQPTIIVVITDKALRDELSKLNADVMGKDIDPFYGAPCIMLVLANKERSTYLYDGSLVMGNLMNAAQSVGLGSCWIHRAKEVFSSERGKQLLAQWGIEGDYEGIGHVAIGYAAKPPIPPKPRKENGVIFI